jgi:sugar lactone lactonase YvrE
MRNKKISLIIIMVFQLLFSCKKNEVKNTPGDSPQKGGKWVVSTVAGNGTPHFADGPALMSEFRAPQDVAATADGIIYVADAINHRIRKIAEGQVTTFAGFNKEDTAGGIGPAAGFAIPIQVVADLTGNLYTLDVDDFRVRKITPAALVTVVAGNGIRGFADGRADSAEFGESIGIVTDQPGNIYVSDWENERVRKISITGQVTTIARGLSASGIVIDKQGNLFVGDRFSIKKITQDRVVSIFAGSDSIGYRDGQANVALFGLIGDMVIDEQGNIYLTDDNRVRKITSQGVVSTIAGSSTGYKDGDAASAKFNGANGLGIDKQGNIYVADSNNNRIRKISFE